MANTFLTNSEVLDLLELPDTIVDDLRSNQASVYTPAANQFLEALVNKIVYQTVDGFGFKNPFKKFDGFPINYGDTIENIYVETPKGYTFNKDATDPFTKFVNDVKTIYNTINYQRQYGATIQDSLLRRACLNEYGFNNIINEILRQLTTSKNVEEYEAQIAGLNNAELYGNSTGAVGSKQFEVLNVGGLTDEKTAETITKKIIDIFTSFEQPSRSHNVLGVLTASNKENLNLIIKRNILNSINLDFLTGVFNLSKVELLNKIIVIEDFRITTVNDQEETETQGEDIAFVICEDKFFDNHIALQDGGLIYNPKGKYTNHFLNLWKIFGFKTWYNASAVVLDTTVQANADADNTEENTEQNNG